MNDGFQKLDNRQIRPVAIKERKTEKKKDKKRKTDVIITTTVLGLLKQLEFVEHHTGKERAI